MSHDHHLHHHHHHRAEDTTTDLHRDAEYGVETEPVIVPVDVGDDVGRKDVWYTSNYEHLDKLTTATIATTTMTKYGNSEYYEEGGGDDVDAWNDPNSLFPMLFESSSFRRTSPIHYDLNGDGAEDVLLVESSRFGRIFVVDGATRTLLEEGEHGYRGGLRIPPLHVKRAWFRSPSDEDDDPLDSFFSHSRFRDERRVSTEGKQHGVPVDVLHQSVEQRRRRTEVTENRSKRRRTRERNRRRLQTEQQRADQDANEILENMDASEMEKIASLLAIEATLENMTHNQNTEQQRTDASSAGVRTEQDKEKSKILENVDGSETEKIAGSPAIEAKLENTTHDQSVSTAGEENQILENIDESKMEKIASLLAIEAKLESMTHGQNTNDQQADASSVRTEQDEDTNKILENIDESEMKKIASLLAIEAKLESTMRDSNTEKEKADDRETEKKAGPSVTESKRLEGEERGNNGGVNVEERGSPTTKDNEHSEPSFFDEHSEPKTNPDSNDEEKTYTAATVLEDDVYKYDDVNDLTWDDVLPHASSHHDDAHYVSLDPHVLATPVVVEIPTSAFDSATKTPALVVPVSYFFDEDDYSDDNDDDGESREVAKRRAYASSALLVYDFARDDWRVTRQLDLSTRGDGGDGAQSDDIDDERGAYVRTSPTIVDLDGDSKHDVIVGTSMGFVYAMDLLTSAPKPGFPVQMRAPIHSQIMAVDVVNDSHLELIAVDMNGNIVCLSHRGDTIWTKSLGGSNVVAAGGIALGDVDGDGEIDVVVITVSTSSRGGGEDQRDRSGTTVHALNSGDGSPLRHFPIALRSDARPTSGSPEPPLLIDLHSREGDEEADWFVQHGRAESDALGKEEIRVVNLPSRRKGKGPSHGGSGRGLHVLTPSGDGHLYVIEGSTGCTNSLYVGENVRATPLAENLHGRGRLGILLATSETGQIVTLETPVSHHPLNSYRGGGGGVGGGGAGARVHGRSAKQGILLSRRSSAFRHVSGLRVPVSFEIFDTRTNKPPDVMYDVEIRDGSNPNSRLFSKRYNTTGLFTEHVYVPNGPKYCNLFVILTNENGVRFEQHVRIGYNVHYYKGLEWLIALPLMLAAIPLLLVKKKDVSRKVEEGQNHGILG